MRSGNSPARAASDDRSGAAVTVKRQAELLELSRSNVYYQRQLAHAARDKVRAPYNYAEHSRVSPWWMSRGSKLDSSDR